MKSVSFCLLILLVLSSSFSSAQRLKKTDKLIITNLQAHTAYLDDKTLQERRAGSAGEKMAGEYIRKVFERTGLKPGGNTQSWYQSFELYDGKEALSSGYLTIDNKKLGLFTDYFPFAFSASKAAEGNVSIALAENGFPWFKNLEDIIEDENTSGASISEAVRNKATQAANKGATALIVYTASGEDIPFDARDSSAAVTIPVVYIKKDAFKKYCADESASVDIKLQVALEEKKRTTHNIIGYADNGSDSTVVAGAELGNEANIAALLELARLTKNIKNKKRNYLFVAYSEEQNGTNGAQYFETHPPVNLQKVNYILDIDSVSRSQEGTDGLNLVKRSMDIIKDK